MLILTSRLVLDYTANSSVLCHRVFGVAVVCMGRRRGAVGKKFEREPWRSILGPRPEGGPALRRWHLERRRLTQAWRRAPRAQAVGPAAAAVVAEVAGPAEAVAAGPAAAVAAGPAAAVVAGPAAAAAAAAGPAVAAALTPVVTRAHKRRTSEQEQEAGAVAAAAVHGTRARCAAAAAATAAPPAAAVQTGAVGWAAGEVTPTKATNAEVLQLDDSVRVTFSVYDTPAGKTGPIRPVLL